MAVIFVFSTDIFSAGNTAGAFAPLMRWLFPGISEGSIDFWHFVVRKTGHVSEYFVLAVLACRAFRKAGISLAFAVAFALSDEFHQTFTVSRTGSLVDVGYDAAGAFTAFCMLRWWGSRVKR